MRLLRAAGRGNGIDHVEVDPADHTRVTVVMLRDLPAGPDPWNLAGNPAQIRITGGESVRGITVRTVARRAVDDRSLDVIVSRGGDHSTYTLHLDVPELDPVLRHAGFSFMVACPSDVDPRTPAPEDEPPAAPVLVDTLAKDYASFRRMLLDLAARRHPSLSDPHPADLGMTLLELLAAHADELSYAQDAAALEAYLDTARRRVSVRRHVKLVDHPLHEGRNAVAAVHVAVSGAVEVPTGTRLLTRIPGTLPGAVGPAPVCVPPARLTREALATAPLSAAVVFETAHPLRADPAHNLLHLHHWGEEVFDLPAGATSAWLWAEAADGTPTAVRPRLDPGDRLLIEEVRSPRTGGAADADPGARWLVRLTAVREDSDPAYTDGFVRDQVTGRVVLRERTAETADPLPLLGVAWSAADAPERAVRVRTGVGADGFDDVTVARGNIVLADHGTTTEAEVTPTVSATDRPPVLRLPEAPVTFQIGALDADRFDLSGGPADAVPAVALTARTGGSAGEFFTPVRDLFDSGPNDRVVVVEVDDTGHGIVRFGDGTAGRRPPDTLAYRARFRVGNGTAGNVGAEALAHIGLGKPDADRVIQVRNPLAAAHGTPPETVEHARHVAPQLYRVRQERAVTEADAAAAVSRVAGVRAAVAALRWTGSWYTWLVSVLPADRTDLVDRGGPHQDLSDRLRAEVLAALHAARLAGQDVDVRAPRFVSAELGLRIHARPGHHRSRLRRLVRASLFAPRRPGGAPGPLAVSASTFGRSLELGDVYAAVAAVAGVESVWATLLRRYGRPGPGELAAGRLEVAPWEVLRLDDDPSLPGRGVLRLDLVGGLP